MSGAAKVVREPSRMRRKITLRIAPFNRFADLLPTVAIGTLVATGGATLQKEVHDCEGCKQWQSLQQHSGATSEHGQSQQQSDQSAWRNIRPSGWTTLRRQGDPDRHHYEPDACKTCCPQVFLFRRCRTELQQTSDCQASERDAANSQSAELDRGRSIRRGVRHAEIVSAIICFTRERPQAIGSVTSRCQDYSGCLGTHMPATQRCEFSWTFLSSKLP